VIKRAFAFMLFWSVKSDRREKKSIFNELGWFSVTVEREK